MTEGIFFVLDILIVVVALIILTAQVVDAVTEVDEKT